MRGRSPHVQGLAAAWALIRALSGDDAYERYLEETRALGPDQGPPLDRKRFEHLRVQRRWSGITRCC